MSWKKLTGGGVVVVIVGVLSALVVNMTQEEIDDATSARDLGNAYSQKVMYCVDKGQTSIDSAGHVIEVRQPDDPKLFSSFEKGEAGAAASGYKPTVRSITMTEAMANSINAKTIHVHVNDLDSPVSLVIQ